jgi:hypothetical protein
VKSYGIAKVGKAKTDNEYVLKSFTTIEADIEKYTEHECLTILLLKNVLFKKFKSDQEKFTEVKNHQFQD